MKKPYTLTIFLLLSISLQAQVNRDSLKAIWYDTSPPDTCRLDAIGKLSFEGYFLSAMLDSALYAAQLQYDFAEKQGLKKYMALA